MNRQMIELGTEWTKIMSFGVNEELGVTMKQEFNSQIYRNSLRLKLSVFVGFFLTIFLLLFVTPIATIADGPWYVSPDGTDNTSCSVTSPCRTIQYAIDNATSGDEIHVAAGTYTETVAVTKRLTVKGGYTTANWFAAPDPAGNATIINPQRTGRVLYIGNTGVATVTGFHLTGGQTADGGGVYNAGSLVLENNRIYNNIDNSGGGGVGGGGIANSNTGLLTLRYNQIYSNTSVNWTGGGIGLMGGTALIEANEIYSNTASSVGGGIYTLYSALTLRNNLIYANTNNGFGGGGVYIDGNTVIYSKRLRFGLL